MSQKNLQKKNLSQALSYLLNAKFKVHDNVVFHEVDNYLLVTTLDRVEVVYKLTGFFAQVLKVIFSNAAHGAKDVSRFVEAFDAESAGLISGHKAQKNELEENIVRLYAFLISNGFLEDRSAKGHAQKPELNEMRLNHTYRIGPLESQISLLNGTNQTGFALTDEELAVYVAGTMTACSSY